MASARSRRLDVGPGIIMTRCPVEQNCIEIRQHDGGTYEEHREEGGVHPTDERPVVHGSNDKA
jgi:hypothetical protein